MNEETKKPVKLKESITRNTTAFSSLKSAFLLLSLAQFQKFFPTHMLAGISRIVKQEANKNTDSFSKMVQNKAVKTRKLLQIFSFSGPRKFHQMPLTQK